MLIFADNSHLKKKELGSNNLIHKNKLWRSISMRHSQFFKCRTKKSLLGKVTFALLLIAIAHSFVNCLPPALAVDRSAGILALVDPLLLALELVVAVEAIAV
jgi:hypothetical protein